MKALTERQRTLTEHVAAAKTAGLKLSDYARREGMNVQVLYQHRKREKQRGGRDGAFVRMVSAEPMLAAPVQVRFPNGVSVALGVDAKAVAALLTTLARL